MPIKESKGNMYPWVDATHSHLGGECQHKCSYCYVGSSRFGRAERYCGEIRVLPQESSVKYDEKTLKKVCGKYPATIFVEHMNDLFAKNVPSKFISEILRYCNEYPDNTYVLQTKNPSRFFEFYDKLPPKRILGTTIESNRHYPNVMGNAPKPEDRYEAMCHLPLEERVFITLEPVLDFDIEVLASWIADINPEFLNLGADSKGQGLEEPTVEKIMSLVDRLHVLGIELREKSNLNRLKAK